MPASHVAAINPNAFHCEIGYTALLNHCTGSPVTADRKILEGQASNRRAIRDLNPVSEIGTIHTGTGKGEALVDCYSFSIRAAKNIDRAAADGRNNRRIDAQQIAAGRLTDVERIVASDALRAFVIALHRSCCQAVARVKGISQINGALLRLLEEGVIAIATTGRDLADILDALSRKIDYTEIVGRRLILSIDAI